jgi:hypothetical protein
MAVPDPIWLRAQTIATRRRVIIAATGMPLVIFGAHVAYEVPFITYALLFALILILFVLFLFVFGSLACTVVYLTTDALDSTTPFRVSDYVIFRVLIIREAIRG